jgi:chitodextrinase
MTSQHDTSRQHGGHHNSETVTTGTNKQRKNDTSSATEVTQKKAATANKDESSRLLTLRTITHSTNKFMQHMNSHSGDGQSLCVPPT